MSSAPKKTRGDAQHTIECAHRVLHQHGKSFHFASHFLDKKTASHCARLYTFCRYVDDIADDASDPEVARKRLHALIDMLRKRQSTDPVVADLLRLAASQRMSIEPAVELVRGILSDVSKVRIRDVAELHQYCYRVAGTVGLLMCGVLDVRDVRAYPFAIDLGIGMQLTNIARDVLEDARAGRRYLPATIIGEVSPTCLTDPDQQLQRRIVRAVHWLLDEADHYYHSGESGLVFLPSRARLAIRIASRVYHRIGVRIRQHDFAVWRGRAIVPLWQKAFVAMAAIKTHYIARPRAGDPPPHRYVLHRWLQGLAGTSRIHTVVRR